MYKKGAFTSHPDIELGFERKPVEYYINFPEQGVNRNTGLIFSICAHGEKADSEYMLNKLNPHMASKANCLVVGLNYHGIDRTGLLIYDADILKLAESIYGYKDNQPNANTMIRIRKFFQWAQKNGISRLDSLFKQVIYVNCPEYYSSGFLPALDHLAILKEIISEYRINPNRIAAYGSSYGGFIAHLIAKFAPDTLALVIDNSGFSHASLMNTVGRDILIGEILRESEGVVFPWIYNQPWTILDEKSPYYFSDACRSIRNLMEKDHYVSSETKYYIYHCTNDHVTAPISEKDRVVDCLRDSNHSVYYKRVTEQDLDGRIFKTFEHAMNASLIGIFDLVMAEEGKNFGKSSEQNDFTINKTRVFDCGAKQYIFNYHDDYSMDVRIEDTVSYIRRQ